jgi:hypothetical protein
VAMRRRRGFPSIPSAPSRLCVEHTAWKPSPLPRERSSAPPRQCQGKRLACALRRFAWPCRSRAQAALSGPKGGQGAGPLCGRPASSAGHPVGTPTRLHVQGQEGGDDGREEFRGLHAKIRGASPRRGARSRGSKGRGGGVTNRPGRRAVNPS